MLNNYEFEETSSQNIEVEGVKQRVVYFRSRGDSGDGYTHLNIDGSVIMPLMDYFMAGVDGSLDDKIRDLVVLRITSTVDPVEDDI